MDEDERKRMLERARARRQQSEQAGQPIEDDARRSPAECREAWQTAKPWREDEVARRFLEKERGLSLDSIPADAARVIEGWRVNRTNAKPCHALAFPLEDPATGEIVGLQVRRFDARGRLLTKPAKSLTSGNKGVYRLGRADARRVILVDGQEDALAIWQILGGEAAGVAVWALTTVSFNFSAWPLLEGREFVFLLDRGAHEESVGEKQSDKMARAGHRIRIAGPVTGAFGDGRIFKDANDALMGGAPDAVVQALQSPRPPPSVDPRLYADPVERREFWTESQNMPGYPFERGKDDEAGAFYVSIDTGGDVRREFLCAAFEIKGTVQDARGENTRRIIEYRGKRHVIPLARLVSRDLLSVLADFDLAVNAGLLSWLRALLTKWRGPVIIDYGQAGHLKGGGFLTIAGRYIGPKRSDQPRLIEPMMGGHVDDFQPQGTLEGWRDAVARPALAYPHAVMALGFGLASGLVGYLEEENRTVFWGGESGTGKTTLLKIVASMIGPCGQFVRNAGASGAGFRALACSLSGHPLLLDELEGGAIEALNTLSYGHSTGLAPDRYDLGDKKNRDPLRWQSILQISGEVDPAALAAMYKRQMRGGQEVRMMALHVRNPTRADNGRFGLGVLSGMSELRAAIGAPLLHQYGTAYPAFIAFVLTRDKAALQARLEKITATYLDRVEFDAQFDSGNVRRAGRLFALAAMALELAFECGVFPGELRDASCANGMPIRAVPVHFLRLWLEQRGGKEAYEVQSILAILRVWISEHATEFTRILSNGRLADEGLRGQLGYLIGPYFGADDPLIEEPEPERALWISSALLFGRVFAGTGFPPDMIRAVLREKGVVPGEMNGDKWRFSSQAPRAVTRLTGWRLGVRLDLGALGAVELKG